MPPMLVTREARNNAKAVNFGIVYGISAFGLAANLGISRKEAETYIKAYFERYSGVKRFIDETIAGTRETGVARTLFGRERPIPDINSRNPERARIRRAHGREFADSGHCGGPDQAGDGDGSTARSQGMREHATAPGSRRTGAGIAGPEKSTRSSNW